MNLNMTIDQITDELYRAQIDFSGIDDLYIIKDRLGWRVENQSASISWPHENSDNKRTSYSACETWIRNYYKHMSYNARKAYDIFMQYADSLDYCFDWTIAYRKAYNLLGAHNADLAMGLYARHCYLLQRSPMLPDRLDADWNK